MSQDLPIPRQDNRPDEPAVVAWGHDETDGPDRPVHRLAGLGRDRRLPAVLAGLGAVAAFASLVGEWSVMTVPRTGPTGEETIQVPAGVADVGNFGTGYLIGLLALAGCVALVLFGSPGARHNARVLALTLAGGLLVLLATGALALEQAAERRLFYPADEGFRLDYGRGLAMAFVAAALLGLAAYRAGGQLDRSHRDGDGAPTRPGRWRQRPATTDRDDHAGPADLTVEPAVPFARPEPLNGR